VSDTDVLATPAASGLVIRGGMVRVGSYLAATGLGFLATPLVARYLGVDDFGRYVTVGTLIATTALVSDAGLAIVGTREYVVRDADGRTSLVRNMVGVRAAMSVLGVAGAVIFAALAGYSIEMVVGAALAGFGLVLLMVQQVYTIPLQVDLRLGVVAALDFARAALTVLGILIVIVLSGGLLSLFAIPIPVAGAGLVATVVLMRGRVALAPGRDLGEWRHLLREALPIAIASTIGAFFYRSALLVMSIIGTPTETGYFSASFRVVETILVAAALMTTSAFPIVARAAHEDPARLRYAMQRLFDVAIILGAWSAIGVIVGAEAIMRFIGGSEFEPASSVLRIQGLALSCSFLIAVWASGLWALRRQRALAWANLLGVSLTIGLTIVLVPVLDAKGAAIATTTVEFLVAAMYAFILIGGHRDLRPALPVVPKAAVAAIPALAAWFLPIPDVVRVVVATVLYFVVLAALRGIPPDVYDALRGRWHLTRSRS
jgi:O-antigen/teichoic acid export membrane protein